MSWSLRPATCGIMMVYRLFAYLRLDGDGTHDPLIDNLEKSGVPVIRIRVHDLLDLGGQYFLWEMATAIASHRLGINPFDQPNVEAAKLLAREIVSVEGGLPEQTPQIKEGDLEVFGEIESESVSDALSKFLNEVEANAYFCIQAYLHPSQEIYSSLQSFRTALRDRTHIATTLGFGPRYLHSTGQLHKGDRGNGRFIQITSEDHQDVAIPDEPGAPESSLSFGRLKSAQAIRAK